MFFFAVDVFGIFVLLLLQVVVVSAFDISVIFMMVELYVGLSCVTLW